ncbi:hypothetical protein WR25_26576 [Diploscapter pachys]|uniref:Uncharacterized protein n=1 Tax=Diploscapter pachys TaxID=2018661 RepID=A0A2A2KCJ0_9BILA|nr:hypothetical protein WR25_26576 [Diploscapter pachys]
MIERCVVVQRQQDGYGFTVTGEHPVYVHTVKQDGAAYCAGVRQGERIMKVNGMPVTSNNHLEVIRMISGGQNVVLTLLGKPPDPMPVFHTEIKSDQKLILNDNNSSIVESADNDWRKKRKDLLNQMLEDERRHAEKKREREINSKEGRDKGNDRGLRDKDKDYNLRENSHDGEQLTKSLKRITCLQSQLHQIRLPFETHTPAARAAASPVLNALSTMDDSDEDDAEMTPIRAEESGPFANLAELKTKPGHLAAFTNYLLSNGNASSFFFYLITDAYQQIKGPPKDIRRWAFELFTTFVIPNSPLCIPSSDQSIIQPIDKMLSLTIDHITDSDSESLKRAFVAGRQKAVTDVNEQLAEFRHKRSLGAGSLFEPNQLTMLVRGDGEIKVGEQIFFQVLESMRANDFDNLDVKSQAIATSIATIVKIMLPKISVSNDKFLDKIPHFLAKEKPGKSARKPPSNIKSKTQIKGHVFTINAINTVHYCYQCRDATWGLQPWMYFCNNCDVKIHPQCSSSLVDTCYPATQTKKSHSKSRLSGLIGKSIESDHEENNLAGSSSGHIHSHSHGHNAKSVCSDGGVGVGSEIDKKSDRSKRAHSMKNKGLQTILQHSATEVITSHSHSHTHHHHRNDHSHPESSRGPVRRDRSTPSWSSDFPPAEEEVEELEPVLRSRKISADGRKSLEGSRLAIDLQSISGSSSVSHTSLPEEEVRRMMERMSVSVPRENDSDIDIDTDVPSIEERIGYEAVKHLKPKEKKRQEIINEFFHTEKTHVRNLKILLVHFCQPMLRDGIVSPDMINLLFANLDEVLAVHKEILTKIRESDQAWLKNQKLHGMYGDVSELMVNLFEGEIGQRLMEVTSKFCQHQQHALDILRIRCKKDKEDALIEFLSSAESHPMCRKLQLKDMIPVEMQRLVKYPLMLEMMANVSVDEREEEVLRRVVISAKRILSAVNTAKRNAENKRRLEELQKRVDMSACDRDLLTHEYGPLNLLEQHLIHDGSLTCRFNRGKQVELHVVLLESTLILFTKHSDGHRLTLKSLEPSKENKWNPILPLAPLIAKEKANDKRAFFLVFNNMHGAQIFELVAGTATERKTWYKLILDQIEQDKKLHPPVKNESPFPLGASNSNDTDAMAKVQVVTHPRLVNANEITVQQPTILEHAQPILTNAEKLKRSDEIIMQALATKLTILAEYLPGDKQGQTEEVVKMTEMFGGMAVADLKQKDGKELAMSAIVHGNRLLDSINQSMNLAASKKDEQSRASASTSASADGDSDRHLPSVPCYKLTAIAAPLMNHLKALMQSVQDLQAENHSLREQILHYRELAGNDRSVSEETLTEQNRR